MMTKLFAAKWVRVRAWLPTSLRREIVRKMDNGLLLKNEVIWKLASEWESRPAELREGWDLIEVGNFVIAIRPKI